MRQVLWQWRVQMWRTIIKLVVLGFAVLIVLQALRPRVSVGEPEPDRKAKAARVDERRADREAKSPARSPTPTPPAAAAEDETETGRTADKLQSIGLIVCAVIAFFLLLPVLVGVVGFAGAIMTGTRDEKGAVERGGVADGLEAMGEGIGGALGGFKRKRKRTRERLEADVEIARLRKELATLQREGQAPLLRGQQITATETPEHPPRSTNGVGPHSD